MNKKNKLQKKILDACCGGRLFWFNKKHPKVLFIDSREEHKGFIKQRKNFEVMPDKVMDFRKMEFPDESFHLVVFDPPHLLKIGKTSQLAKKYGHLTENRKDDLKK